MRIIPATMLALAAGAMPALAMDLSFDWGPTKACFDPKSPPLHVDGVPKGTTRLDFVMHDRDAPSFHHGGGSVRYRGQSEIGYGAFRYRGPCPPSPHHYEFTVTARDGKGHVLAEAKATRIFPQR